MTVASMPRQSTVIAALASAAFAVFGAGSANLGSGPPTLLACLAIAVFGLPHGTFDLHLLRQRGQDGATLSFLLALYLGCAAATAVLWWVHPAAALTVFLLIAVVHFAEDWVETRSSFLSAGIALAIIAAPAVLHLAALQEIFTALTGSGDAARLGDVLVLVAPIALAVAAAGVFALVQNGRGDTALAAACSVGVMLVLPPVVGFALFFCLFHSPRHFRAALRDLRWRHARQWLPVVVPLTLAAIGIVAGLYAVGAQVDVAIRMVAATFMALSILTVPHMAVPVILAALSRQRGLLRG